MKIIIFILCCLFSLLSCNKLCKDENLSLKRISYTGKELKTDGYFYNHWKSDGSLSMNSTVIFFLYRNGIILSAGSVESTDLEIVEKEINKQYEFLYKKKIGYGVFIVENGKLLYEQWSTSAGGCLPVFQSSYTIENDSTLINPYGEIYHFRQFSTKPDSIIANKWIN